ncbi:hypothetical protein D7147_02960 [Micromonospora musae]|uniref:Uncharacterized protein n=1 Tax=Micromonospora musae TaxID=1894970 RepID=A0A3A9YC55_9ACTN|nr:hypothetical protein [Micromonospora musae]RKN23989.1 hypothetical protein D7147_02960 [Micromonospora musae]RKN31694.1 hypothetical protein D7044_15445 [Micromonospora musae]
MNVVNVVQKFGADDFLERSWELPSEMIEPLREHVNVGEDGWIIDAWPMTKQIAAIVQPRVTEHIDVASGAWFVESWCGPEQVQLPCLSL